MQPTQRRDDAGLIGRLLDEPYRFEFFQATRLLERWLSGAGTSDREPRAGDVVARCLRFRNTLSLAFPASEIESIRASAASSADADANFDDRTRRYEVVPTFFGLLGAHGALPLHYTERIATQEHARHEHTASEFLDIFTNRATALFYRAWKKYRLALHDRNDADRSPRDGLLPVLLALAGVAHGSKHTGPYRALPPEAAAYALAARHRPMSAAYLERALSHCFAVPVRVEQFVGKWCELRPDQLTMPGRSNAVLGRSARLGRRVFVRNLRVGLVIGPLTQHEYDAFQRGGARTAALERMLALLVGFEFEYRVWLVLHREHIGRAALDRSKRLGIDAFVCTRAVTSHRAATAFDLRPLSSVDQPSLQPLSGSAKP